MATPHRNFGWMTTTGLPPLGLTDGLSNLPCDELGRPIAWEDVGLNWRTAPADHLDEAHFPIYCRQCNYCLRGLGGSGRCPECGQPFSRRTELFLQYGLRVFRSSGATAAAAAPSGQTAGGEPARGFGPTARLVIRAGITALVVLAALTACLLRP